jgi:photosystem II stability/assembly factor-like uncharacterized protein
LKGFGGQFLFALLGATLALSGCAGQAPALARSSTPKLDYKESYREWLEERAYPNKEVDWSAWPRAVAQRDRLRPMPVAYAAGPGSAWTFFGPTNLPAPYRTYYGQGTMNGRVNDLAFDPSNPGTFYLASATGGIWKTEDSGQNWTPLSDDWPSLAANSVAIHPTDPDLIFAGTGDWDGGYPYAFGLMRSSDGGNSWANIGAAQFGNTCIRRIMIDPDNPSRMMLATGKGPAYWGRLWLSTDAGLTWFSPLSQTSAWSDIECSLPYENGGRWYYASGLGDGGHVWRSGDRGITWERLSTPLPTSFQNGVEIAASKVDKATVYLLSGSARKVYKSVDAGGTWTDITAGFPNGNNNYNWSQSSYDFYIETSKRTIAKAETDVIYVGLIDVVQSPDAGATWRSIGLTYTSGALTHNDQHVARVNPNDPDEVLIGNDGGAYLLHYNSSANSWSFDTSLSKRLGITQFYKGDFHPQTAMRMIAGTQDNATPASIGDLANWKNVGGGDGGFCAIRQDQPNTQYATAQYLYIYRTLNNWTSSSNISPNFGSDRVAFIAPLGLRPDSPNLLYAATNYLWRYDQNTGSWAARLGGQELSVSGTVRSLAFAPSDGNTIYTGSNNGEIWLTRNGGATWKQVHSGSPGLPNRFIRYIAVHPYNPTRVYVALSGTGTPHIWTCLNTDAATRVWTSLDGTGPNRLPDIPAQAIAIHPSAPSSNLFVATDIGVFNTSNSGQSWTNVGGPFGLPNVQVNDLKIVAGAGYLYAVTWGRGVWGMPIKVEPGSR